MNTLSSSSPSVWTADEIKRITAANDLHVAPFRADGVTYGTPTYIWSLMLDDALYVRAYNGQHPTWYQAALRQKAGRIQVANMTKEVAFAALHGPLNARIDDAYRAKYEGSRYLNSMVGVRARGATIKVTPRIRPPPSTSI